MEDRKKKILMVNGCIRGKESRTWRLAEAFLKPAREAAPRPFDYTQLDLAQMDLKPLTGGFFEERQRFLEKNDRTHPRFDLARQFAQADRILVAAPFWDLSFPAVLKLYIENISLDGITFGGNAEGLYGMCRAEDMLFFTTRGGFYGDGPMEQGARYLKALCGMLGIPKFRCIAAEGMDFHPEQEEELMAKALEEADEAGRYYWKAEAGR